MLRLLYLAVLIICIAPTIPGMVGMFASAFAYIPPLGLSKPSLVGFSAAFDWSGIGHSIWLTVSTTLISSYLALFATFAILQSCWQTKAWQKIENSLAPLMALPHVAFAIGFAFLFSPTGIMVRALESGLALFSIHVDGNWNVPLIQHQSGVGLIAVLALKEITFFLLMSMPVLAQLRIKQTTQMAHSLGYNDNQLWWKCILPQWLSKMRFPLFAVLAFSASVVDVALVVGPTNPPTFAVLVWQWFNEPNLTLLPRAGAGAAILFALCSAMIAFARTLEWLLVKQCRQWQFSGRYGIALPGKSMFATLSITALICFPILLIWSFAQRWKFPDLLPSRWSERFWQTEWSSVLPTISNSVAIATVSATIALLLAIITHEYRLKHKSHVPSFMIAIPLLVPQISLLFGIQVASLLIGADYYYLWVCWAHVFFAFPYVFLSLDGPWRSYDERYTLSALSLGKSPLRTWLQVKAPIVFPAIIYAWAIGVSVSLAQYLPTLVLGAGRISTITTEAVALSSGYDRRVTAIYALWQALLPFVFFFFAYLLKQHQRRKIGQIKPVRTAVRHDARSRKSHHL